MEINMIALGFGEFLVLGLISVISAAIVHYGFKFYVTTGFKSFVSKVIVGWIGARFGPTLLGKWFTGFNYDDVYYVPALIGSLALIFIVVDIAKTFKKVSSGSEHSTTESNF